MRIRKSFLSLILVFALLLLAMPAVAAETDAENGTMSCASVTLGSDITLNLFARIPADADSYTVEFTVKGTVYTARAEAAATDTAYVFRCPRLGPQDLYTPVTALLKKDGVTVDTSENYYEGGWTIATYLGEVVDLFYPGEDATESQQQDYANLETLVADLFAYGAAAEDYLGLDVHPVPDYIAEKVSADRTLTRTDKTVSNKTDGVVTFRSANLWFANVNRIRFTYTATSSENLVLKINGAEVTPVENADGSFYVETPDIKATGFDTVYTVVAYVNGVQDSAATYSVRSYTKAKQNDTGKIAALARTLLRYGKSAVAYGEILYSRSTLDIASLTDVTILETSFNKGTDPTDPTNQVLHISRHKEEKYTSGSNTFTLADNLSMTEGTVLRTSFRFYVASTTRYGADTDCSNPNIVQLRFGTTNAAGTSQNLYMPTLRFINNQKTPAAFYLTEQKSTGGGYGTNNKFGGNLAYDTWYEITYEFVITNMATDTKTFLVRIYIDGEKIGESRAFYSDSGKDTETGGTVTFNPDGKFTITIQPQMRIYCDLYFADFRTEVIRPQA